MRSFLLLLAACGGASTAAPLSGRATTNAPRGPAPQIAWREGAFDTAQLPRIARDGRIAVLPLIDGDGGRGFANLRLELRDRSDKVVDTVPVLIAHEYEALVPDGLHASPELERRIASANAKLADLHAAHDLVAMRVLTDRDDIAVTFGGDHRLAVRAGGASLAVVDGTSWLAPSTRRCAQCRPCENPASLAAAYHADGIDAVVVRITYAGTDLCWEPGDQLHVVAW